MFTTDWNQTDTSVGKDNNDAMRTDTEQEKQNVVVNKPSHTKKWSLDDRSEKGTTRSDKFNQRRGKLWAFTKGRVAQGGDELP